MCIPILALTSLHGPLASAQWTVTYIIDRDQALAAIQSPARVDKMFEAADRAKKKVEQLLVNSTGSVQLTINWATPVGPNSAAEAQSSEIYVASLASARDKLINRAEADSEPPSERLLYESLPTGTVPFRFDTASVQNASSVAIPNSLNKHLGFALATNQNDGTITFRPPGNVPIAGFDWQFWDSKKTLPLKQSFEDVLIHVTFHTLGFRSRAESQLLPTFLFTWDLFRFADPDVPINATNFTTTPRELRPTVEASGITAFNNAAQSYKLSRGTRTGGDDQEASHWRLFSRLNPPTPIGIMDPQGGGSARNDLGEKLYTSADARALDVMGWNVNQATLSFAEPSPVNLVSPAALAQIPQGTPITFQWDASGFDNVSVNIASGTEWDEVNGVFQFYQLPAETLSATLPAANDLPPGEYVWSVTASTDCCSTYSQDRRFTIVASITPCSPADVGKQGGLIGPDGQLNNDDFAAFITLFFANDPRADLGQQGGVPGSDGNFDNNDFTVFNALFFQGCP